MAKADKMELTLPEILLVDFKEKIEILEQIQRHLKGSSHGDKNVKKKRKRLGNLLDPLNSLLNTIDTKGPEPATASAKSTSDRKDAASNRLEWGVICETAKSYQRVATKPITITVDVTIVTKLQGFEEVFQEVCEELRGSKSPKKKTTRDLFSRYAPGILYIIQSLTKSQEEGVAHRPESRGVDTKDVYIEDKYTEKAPVPDAGRKKSPSGNRVEPRGAPARHSHVTMTSSIQKTGNESQSARQSRISHREDNKVKESKDKASSDGSKKGGKEKRKSEIKHMEHREKEIQKKEGNIKHDQEELAKTTEGVKKRSDQTEYEKRQMALEKREHKVVLQEKDLCDREEKIQEKEGNIKHDQEQLAKNIEGLKKWEQALAEQEAELKRHKDDVDRRQSELMRSTESMKTGKQKPKKEIKQLEQRYNEQLGNFQTELEKQRVMNEDLRQRLAKEMGDKVSSNESAVENISIKHRPMNVAEQYCLFQSEEWLDAKQCLDDHLKSCSEADKVSLLAKMLEITENKVCEALDYLNQKLEGILLQPARYAVTQDKRPISGREMRSGIDSLIETSQPLSARKVSHGAEKSFNRHTRSTIGPAKNIQRRLPLALKNALGDYFRVEVDNCDFRSLVEHTTKEISTSCQEIKPILTYEAIESYVASMVRLCWTMAIQRPPMTFDFSRKRVGDKFQDLFWGSDDVEDAEIFIVYPLLKHGEKIVGKGKIFLVKKYVASITL